jgi:hypothetical protein
MILELRQSLPILQLLLRQVIFSDTPKNRLQPTQTPGFFNYRFYGRALWKADQTEWRTQFLPYGRSFFRCASVFISGGAASKANNINNPGKRFTANLHCLRDAVPISRSILINYPCNSLPAFCILAAWKKVVELLVRVSAEYLVHNSANLKFRKQGNRGHSDIGNKLLLRHLHHLLQSRDAGRRIGFHPQRLQFPRHGI